MMIHPDFMHRCLQLALRARRRVGSGALVGAVLVRDDRIIAEGYHEGWGKAHAERALLEKFDQKISSTDTLYVNLEPCCHHGKTPPCTDIILERGIKRVVFGMYDPDPRVAGKGIALLRSKGVDAIGPVERARSEYLNRGFVSVRTRKRPWIILKQARAADGRTAGSGGVFIKITTPEQDAWSHASLRDRTDAILVGVKTVLTDDPQLSTRIDRIYSQEEGLKQNYRIILDPHLRLPLHANVVSDDHKRRTIVVYCSHAADVDPAKRDEIAKRGVRFIDVDFEQEGSFALDQLWPQLINPDGDYHGLTSILVEGGAKTWGLFQKAGVVDEEVTLVGR